MLRIESSVGRLLTIRGKGVARLGEVKVKVEVEVEAEVWVGVEVNFLTLT